MKDVLEDFGIVFIGLLAIFAGVCIVTTMGNWLDNKAEAKPEEVKVGEGEAKENEVKVEESNPKPNEEEQKAN